MFITKTYVRGLIMAILLIGAVQCKDHRCHRPVTKNCDASESYISGWKFTGWYFDTVMGSCRPLFTKNGWHICTENYDLPYTRESCENLCADPCTMTTGAPGICIYNEICMMYNFKPPFYRPCKGNNLNCCPMIPDRDLKSFGGLQYERDGIVQVGVIRDIKNPAYPPDAYTYLYYLPSHFSKDGKNYY
eukprot:XP_016663142.1 PREDICTED: uncharacterized protein LOC107884795 [Acyrthosiphon pisum]